jgi:hypothetical protein
MEWRKLALQSIGTAGHAWVEDEGVWHACDTGYVAATSASGHGTAPGDASRLEVTSAISNRWRATIPARFCASPAPSDERKSATAGRIAGLEGDAGLSDSGRLAVTSDGQCSGWKEEADSEHEILHHLSRIRRASGKE